MDLAKPLLALVDHHVSEAGSEDSNVTAKHDDAMNCEECRRTDDPNCSVPCLVEEINDKRDDTDYRFRIQFHLPKASRKFLTKGQTLLQLMREMHTKIVVPNKKKKGNCVVTGCTETSVEATYLKMQQLVANSQRKSPPTHFVSIPMNTSHIRERFEIFKNEVLDCCGSDEGNIVDELFTSPGKLHLTLCVLTLSEEPEVVTACRRLDECRERIIEPLAQKRPIVVRVRGIEIMNNDPTKARILYAKAESTDDILQKLADEVATVYTHDGFSEKNQRDQVHVKLHITLMNTKFLQQRKKRLNKRGNISKFDATDILKNFRDFDFGEVSVNTMHLSQMRSPSKNEYYISSNIIQWA